MANAQADRSLLFGILGLQLDFVGREALVAALETWTADKSRSLGEILIAAGALAPENNLLLEVLVERHLARHASDPGKSLAALGQIQPVEAELRHIADADLQDSLSYLPATPRHDLARGLSPGAPPGTRGARFRILRPHARGGLGEVFLAHDEELHRDVALKQILPGQADNPDSRARFLQEAAISGQLEHAGIVPLYGRGEADDGRPYYVMRFIEGQRLQDAVEQFHHSAIAGRDPFQKTLLLRRLLARFLDVCRTLDYAHSRGVIHRDVKPSNILLSAYGETFLIDWGLAKSVNRVAGKNDPPQEAIQAAPAHSPTRMGAALGTPAYMSPEQAAGRLDRLGPASDVYGLGATLYFFLTGHVPFDEPDTGVLLQKVQRGEFPRPRLVNRDVPSALEAICLKAMALRPEDRHVSPGNLAEDLEHWLADGPVSVYRLPWPQGLGRWARRHRTVGGVTLLLVAIGVAAAGAALYLLWPRLTQTLVASRTETSEVTGSQPTPEATPAEKRPTESKPAETPRAVPSKETESEVYWNRRGLEHYSLDQLEEARIDFSESIKRKPEDSTGWNGRALVYGRLQQWEKAVDDFTEALKRNDALAPCWDGRGEAHAKLNKWTEAAADYSRAIKLKPDNATYRFNRAMAHEKLGRLREALADCSRAVELEPGNDQIRMSRVSIARTLGQWDLAIADCSRLIERNPRDERLWLIRGGARQDAGQLDNALTDIAEALKLKPGWVNAYQIRALTYMQRKQWQQALVAYTEIVQRAPEASNWKARAFIYSQMAQWENAAADYSRAIALKGDDAMTRTFRGNAYFNLGQLDKALPDYSQAIESDAKNPNYWNNRGNTYFSLGQWDKAVADYSRAIELQGNVAVYWGNRGGTHARLEQWVKTVADYSRAIELDAKNPAYWHDRGSAYASLGQWDKAMPDYSRAIELDAKNPVYWYKRRTAHGFLDRYKEGISDLDRALQLAPDNVQYLIERGAVYVLQNDWERAFKDLDRAIVLKPGDASSWRVRAGAYGRRGDWDKAIADWSKVLELKPDDAESWSQRARIYGESQRWDKAIADWSKVLQLKPADPFVWNERGAAHSRGGYKDKALADFSEAIRVKPDVPLFWRNRGALRAIAGKWSEAALDYSEVRALKSDEVLNWSEHLLVLREVGDDEGQRKACAEMVRRCGKTQDPESAYRLICCCTRVPEAGVDRQALQRLADEVLGKPAQRAWAARSAGMLHYRAGRFEQAVSSLREAIKAQGTEGEVRDWLFLAMAHQRLGHAPESRKWLDRAIQETEKAFADQAKGNDHSSMIFWENHELRLLRREAEALVNGTKP